MGTLNDALTSAKSETNRIERELRDARNAAEAALAKAERARRNGYNTVEENTMRYEQAQQRADTLGFQHKAAEEAEREAHKALEAAQASRWEARYQRMRDLIEMVAVDHTIRLEGRNYGWTSWSGTRYTVGLTEINKQGERDRRFGYEADVHAPELRQRYDRETQALVDEWEPATINWGTIGTLRIADAQDMMRVHSAAIALAQLLEATRDEWYAQDMAD